MKKFLIALLLFSLNLPLTHAAVQGKEVSYQAEGVTMKGYLAFDDAVPGKRPAVLVVHEWWGHNDYARHRARMLAELGYVALAVDMYGNGKQAEHPDDAGKFAGEVSKNLPVAKARFDAAMDMLKKQENVDAGKLAAFGYCFGGGIVLNMARMGADLRAAVSFHGSLGSDTPAKPGVIKGRVASFTGEADPMIGANIVAAFKQEMELAKVNYRAVTYPDAKHGFTNPGADALGKKFNLPLAYDASADKDSWKQATAMLKEVFDEK